MLEKLRKGATTKVAAVIIFFPLIIAFAIWGVADVFRGYGQGSLATVGKTEISQDAFQQAYQNELAQLSQRFGRRLTPDQARMLGLESRVLSRLVGTAALDLQVKELGLGLSERAIAETIQSDPSFAGADGKFSRTVFDAILRQNGLSERGYLALRRSEDLRDQLTDSVLSVAAVPEAMIDQLHRYREERRVIEFMTVDAERIVKVAEPDEAKLKAHYEGSKRSYNTPEMRKLAVLLMTRDKVKAGITVSDEDIKAAYEADRSRYETPERRRVLQAAFPDKAAADKAQAALAAAKDFVEAAGKLGFKANDVDLGVVAKRDMIDPKIAEAAFKLAANATSAPVEGRFSHVVLRVTEITPGKVRLMDEVKSEVRDRLADERAGREIQGLHDKVDDARGGGSTLKATAEKLGLEYREIEAIDRSGNGPDGKPALDHKDAARILNAAFGGTQGAETDAIELADGGYGWFDILKITPEAERAYEQVQADVRKSWTEAEKSRLLIETVAKLAERVGNGEAMAAIAKEAGGKPETSEPLTRQSVPTGISSAGVTQAFALAPNAAGSVPTSDGKSRTLFRVVSTKPADAPTKEQADKLRAELARNLQSDAVSAYVGGLQTRYGVRVNDALVRQTLGLDRAGR